MDKFTAGAVVGVPSAPLSPRDVQEPDAETEPVAEAAARAPSPPPPLPEQRRVDSEKPAAMIVVKSEAAVVGAPSAPPPQPSEREHPWTVYSRGVTAAASVGPTCRVDIGVSQRAGAAVRAPSTPPPPPRQAQQGLPPPLGRQQLKERLRLVLGGSERRPLCLQYNVGTI